MFGRIRASSSSPDSLERPPSKLFKDDPLSIYEATLMKLKLGSQRKLGSSSEQTVQIENDSALSSSCSGALEIKAHCSSASTSKSFDDIEISSHEEIMAVDTECSPESSSTGSIDSRSTGRTKSQSDQNLCVLYLLSKFKNSRHVVSSSCEDAMPVEDTYSASVSTSSSDCQSLGSMELQMDQQCVSSLPLCQM